MADENSVVNKAIVSDGTTNPSPKPLLGTVTPFVEVVSKGIAGIAIALYACGFLIVSLHHSHYGFTETNPFRPRILAAGAWFFFLIAIPLVTMSHFGWKKNWEDLGVVVFPYYWACVLGTLYTQYFVDFEFPPFFSHFMLVLIAATVVVLGVFVLVSLRRSWKHFSRATAATLASLTVFFVVWTVRETAFKHFGIGALILWFFGIGVTVALEPKLRTSRLDQISSAFLALASLFIFGTYY